MGAIKRKNKKIDTSALPLQYRGPSAGELAARVIAAVRGFFSRLLSGIGRSSGKAAQGYLDSARRSPGRTVLSTLLALVSIASVILAIISYNAPDGRINVQLTADGKSVNCRTWPGTVGELLSRYGLDIYSGDELYPAAQTELADGMEIELTRAFPVAVESAGTVRLLSVTGGTVGDVLDKAGVEFDVDDELTHLEFEDAEPGMQIRHNDVEISYKTAERTIYYEEIVNKDDTMYNDLDPIIEQTGSDGLKKVTERITTKNGLEVAREIVDQEVLVESVDEIKRVGTKIHYQTNYYNEWRLYKKKPVAGKNGWVEYKIYRATGYCTGNRTATGTRPDLGTIAVNPKLIPYGTQIWVPGYGYGVARDTGAFRNYAEPRNNAIDLWFNKRSEAVRWGSKRDMTILVKLG